MTLSPRDNFTPANLRRMRLVCCCICNSLYGKWSCTIYKRSNLPEGKDMVACDRHPPRARGHCHSLAVFCGCSMLYGWSQKQSSFDSKAVPDLA